jgi:hypothetical protein
VPFYSGTDSSVIPVFSPSNLFHGYFPHAFAELHEHDFDYWFVIADDMIVNPEINEHNLPVSLGIGASDIFFPSLHAFDPCVTWVHAWKSLAFSFGNQFLTIADQLPSVVTAERRLRRRNLEFSGLQFTNIYRDLGNVDFNIAFYGPRFLDDRLRHDRGQLLFSEYPFCWGYSDVFCLGRENISDFCRLAGVFSAAGLFVEIAIPTAVVLSCKGEISLQSDISYRGEALWGDDQEKLSIFGRSVGRLVREFPRDKLFLHPVKLSQWSVDE